MINKHSYTGIFQLTLAQCTIGVNLVVTKYLISVFPIWLLLGLRFFISAIISIVIIQFSKEKIYQNRQGKNFVTSDWVVLFSQALCAGFLFNVLITGGLAYTSATAAGIISSTIPVAIIILSCVFLREKITATNVVAILIITLGLVVLSLGKGGIEHNKNSLLGDLFVLLAVIPEALFTIIAKWYGDTVKPLVMMVIVNLFNALLFLPFTLMSLSQFHFVSAGPQDWVLLILLAFTSNILFYLLWYHGLAKTPTHLAALFTGIMPVSAALLAYLFLHENIYWYHIIGMVCVISSVSLGALTKKKALSLQSRTNG